MWYLVDLDEGIIFSASSKKVITDIYGKAIEIDELLGKTVYAIRKTNLVDYVLYCNEKQLIADGYFEALKKYEKEHPEKVVAI